MKYLVLPTLITCISLSGCGTLLQSITGGAGGDSVGAKALTIDQIKLEAATSPSAKLKDKLEFLGGVAAQSERNCDGFLKQLVLGENAINTTGDVLGTVASALATAVTPPGTKTALSAAATIATGSKTAIDTDIYDKAAISDFSTAIQNTYYTAYRSYTDALPKLTDTDAAPLIVNNEIAKIESMNAECALAPAESAIQAKLGTSATQPQNSPGGAQAPAAPPAATQRGTANKGIENKALRQKVEPNVSQSGTHSQLLGKPW
jgi:uncharacterized protein YceK